MGDGVLKGVSIPTTVRSSSREWRMVVPSHIGAGNIVVLTCVGYGAKGKGSGSIRRLWFWRCDVIDGKRWEAFGLEDSRVSVNWRSPREMVEYFSLGGKI
jgi:hypothetical protein